MKKQRMKKMLLAATTVGAAIAGVTLYLQSKSRKNLSKGDDRKALQPTTQQMAIERGANTMG
jgi:hypothetical protein